MSKKIIRSKTFVQGGITDEEKIRLGDIADEWIAIAMRTTPITPNKIIPAIEGLYKAANLKRPRVVIAPSPLVMAFAYGAAAWIWHCRKNKAAQATDHATEQATEQATLQATLHATEQATDHATLQATEQATLQATHQAILQATFQATLHATRQATLQATFQATDQILPPEQQAVSAVLEMVGISGLKCASRWYGAYQGGNMWAAWNAYLVGFRDVLGLDLPEHVTYKFWEEAAREGGFRVMHEEFCIVSDFPISIKTDDQHRPHCQTGPSHEWRDGWRLYHWHGVRIPAEWIESPKSLTPEIALKWNNVEQRRAACEILGWDKILVALNAAIIDVDDDPEVGTLLECDLPESGKEKFLQVKCGTGRIFCIPVPREMKTALQSNLWTYGLDADRSFLPEVRT